LKVNRRFGGTRYFHIQGEEKAKHEISMELASKYSDIFLRNVG
jgi:hypothetical protein